LFSRSVQICQNSYKELMVQFWIAIIKRKHKQWHMSNSTEKDEVSSSSDCSLIVSMVAAMCHVVFSLRGTPEKKYTHTNTSRWQLCRTFPPLRASQEQSTIKWSLCCNIALWLLRGAQDDITKKHDKIFSFRVFAFLSTGHQIKHNTTIESETCRNFALLGLHDNLVAKRKYDMAQISRHTDPWYQILSFNVDT
jgi:hypothetical protein